METKKTVILPKLFFTHPHTRICSSPPPFQEMQVNREINSEFCWDKELHCSHTLMFWTALLSMGVTQAHGMSTVTPVPSE